MGVEEPESSRHRHVSVSSLSKQRVCPSVQGKRVPMVVVSATMRPLPVLLRWSDRLPAAGALLYIWVVPPRILTVVPGVRGRLDIHPGGGVTMLGGAHTGPSMGSSTARQAPRLLVRRSHGPCAAAMAAVRTAVKAMAPMRAAVKSPHAGRCESHGLHARPAGRTLGPRSS